LRSARAFLQDPYGTLFDLSQTYGPVFAIGYPPFEIVYLIGPEANRLLMVEQPEDFRWAEAYDLLVPIGGKGALIVSDGEEHHRRRRVLQPAFQKSYAASYTDVVRSTIDATLDAWLPGETRDLYAEMRVAIVQIMCRMLGGPGLAAHADTLRRNLEVMLAFANRWPWRQLRVNVPGTAWRQVRRAGAAIDTVIYGEMARRDAIEDQGDVLGLLLRARGEDGALTSDEEVRDLIVSLLTAGFDTSSAAVSWAVYAMLRTPEVWDRASEECDRVIGDRPVASTDLPRLTYLRWVIAETLRLYSPAFLGLRTSGVPFDFFGHSVPAGTLVAYSPYVTHRLPDLWPAADHFLPERWNSTDPDHRPPKPYAYVPFGGGVRRCLGERFAIVEIQIILCQLLRRASIALATECLTPVGLSAMHPREGVPIRIERITRLG
jgi:hypothetical protein